MAFATADDVATRLGRALTSAEESMVELVLDGVTGLICEATDKDLAWADDLDPVPSALKLLCIEKTLAVGSNPNQLASTSEQLGAYQNSKTFRGRFVAGSDLFLTDVEERLARRAVYETNTATTEPESVVDRMIDLAELREVDEDPP